MRTFRHHVQQSLADTTLQAALDANAKRRVEGRHQAFESLQHPDQTRTRARAVRAEAIQNLEKLLEQFGDRLRSKGFHVHHAKDANAAQEIILDIARKEHALLVAKSKSMVSEEIEVNLAFRREGIHVVETDLGEYIVQLRGEHPSHIITPALHLSRHQVAKTFEETLGMKYSTEVADLNQAAHDNLRQIFLEADIGLSGVNFGVAESGTLVLLTNEGNGRMVTTLPRVHIAVMGIERIVPRLQDLPPLLALLPRSATGQKLTSYVSLINHPRKSVNLDGPEERHVILIDNGRSSLRHGPLQESLLCIRCGACLNACPVFREIGGHAYQSTYPGPIGSVISPGLWGVEKFGHLAKASTLCGLCREVCPVDIDLPSLLLRLRHQHQEGKHASPLTSWIMRFYSWLMLSPKRYTWARRLTAIASRILPHREGWLTWGPPPLNRWTSSRDFPPIPAKRQKVHPYSRPMPAVTDRGNEASPPQTKGAAMDTVEHWIEECQRVDGEVSFCEAIELPRSILAVLGSLGSQTVLLSPEVGEQFPAVVEALEEAAYELVFPELPTDLTFDKRLKRLRELDKTQVGLTTADAGLAETGSLVLHTPSVRSNLVSLLPHTHLVILRAKTIFAGMADWLEKGSNQNLFGGNNIIITGPSRTADIEMTLTIGVHGPTKLIVFLVD